MTTFTELLAMARDNLTHLTAAPAPREALRKVIEAHDIVFALFPDQSERGFDTHLIKGKPIVPTLSDDALAKLPTTAVPCADLEEALALERAFGDGVPGIH